MSTIEKVKYYQPNRNLSQTTSLENYSVLEKWNIIQKERLSFASMNLESPESI